MSRPSTLFQLLAVLSIIVIALSCTKGDTGPAGAAGAAGPAGTAGATGAAGPKGTANVIYSDWFTPASYVKDTIFGIWGFNYTKAVTSITQPILDSGTILVFGKLDGYNPSIWPTTQVAQLPIIITYMNGTTPNLDTWSALSTLGNLKIRLVSSTNAYGSISNAHQFRYILIPGGVKTTGSLAPGQKQGSAAVFNASPDADLSEVVRNHSQMGYAEICKRLGVPE